MNDYKRVIIGDGKETTVEQAQQIVTAAREYLERTGTSQATLAKRVGMAASTLSMFLHELAGDWRGIAAELDEYLAEEASRQRTELPEFIETRVARKIIGAAKSVCREGGIGFVHGGSGVGKTTAIQRLMERTPGMLYVSAATASARVKGMLLDIAAATHQYCNDRAAYVVFHRVCEVLRAHSLLVIDEAHKYLRAEDCFDVLRDLLVRTNVPQLWVGTMDLTRHFNRRIDQGREPLAQILSRVTIAVDLNDLKEDGCIFAAAEIRRIIASPAYAPDAQALRYLTKLANLPNQGGLRLVKSLYSTARDLAKAAGKSEVTMPVIDLAGSYLASINAWKTVKAKLEQEERTTALATEQRSEARRATA